MKWMSSINFGPHFQTVDLWCWLTFWSLSDLVNCVDRGLYIYYISPDEYLALLIRRADIFFLINSKTGKAWTNFPQNWKIFIQKMYWKRPGTELRDVFSAFLNPQIIFKRIQIHECIQWDSIHRGIRLGYSAENRRKHCCFGTGRNQLRYRHSHAHRRIPLVNS